MRVDSGIVGILAKRYQAGAASGQQGQAGDIEALAARGTLARMGIREVQPPGSYRAIYDQPERRIVKNVTEERALTATEAVHEDRAITGERAVFEDRAIIEERGIFEDRAVMEERGVFEDRAIMETREIFEDRDVTETRDVYETQAVYEDHDIVATRVAGERSLSGFASISQAGIDWGADFSVKVGDGPMAVLRFDTLSRVSLTVNGQTTRFTFADHGSLGGAVAAALDSVGGLSASLDSGGKLKLETDDARSLAIAEVANGLLDFSGSPLAKLGLAAGTSHASVVGTQQVQTGTQEVLVGTETVVVGSQRVLVGSEEVQIGTEQVQIGTELVQVGTERVQVGTEQVQVGTERVQVGSETVVIGSERVRTGTRISVVGKETVVTGTTTRTEKGDPVLVGLERTDIGIGEALERLKTAASLPPGYVEALFGPVDRGPSEPEPAIRSAYAASWEAEDTGQSDKPQWWRPDAEGPNGKPDGVQP